LVHLHSLHHLPPWTLDQNVLCLIMIQLMGWVGDGQERCHKERNVSCMKDPRNAKIFGWPNYHEQNLCLMKKVKCSKFGVRFTSMLKGNKSSWLPSLIACWKMLSKSQSVDAQCWCKIILFQQKLCTYSKWTSWHCQWPPIYFGLAPSRCAFWA
jgi:hypothetical protein